MTTEEIARDSRLKVLDMVYEAQTSHIGSLLGAADIFAVLFEKIDLEKDVFVLSAGWKAALLYYHLWRKGRITEEELNSYCKEGSKFIGLAEPIIPEIPIAGGSMGLGLPGAVGIALAKKLKGEEGQVYCLMSDGEMAIGTTWESALIAAYRKLDNLTVVVDANGFQAMGGTADILPAFFPNIPDFNFFLTNGHNHDALREHLTFKEGRPVVLWAVTIKGKGVSFMEGDNLWHYAAVKKEDYERAKQELCQK